MCQDDPLPTVILPAYCGHQALTGVLAVTGINIHVAGRQATRAVVAAGRLCRRGRKAATSAVKAFVAVGETQRI